MFMRTFLLIALATITTVSCRDFPVSVACNTSSNALDVPSVSTSFNYITRGDCSQLKFDLNMCDQTELPASYLYECYCTTLVSNFSAWEYAVRNISSGQPCYLDLKITLDGTFKVNNEPTPLQLITSHKNFALLAVGGACNSTEIQEAVLAPFADQGLVFVDPSLNSNSNVTGITWTVGSATVSGCGVSHSSASKLIPASASGSSSGSNTGATTNATSSGSNSNSTSSPTTVSPITPTPTSNASSSSSSSSSSTGDERGTGTSTGNGNGASSTVMMMHSATAVIGTVISAVVAVICLVA